MNKNSRLNQRKMDKTLDDILRYLKSTIFIEDQNYIQFLDPTDVFFNCYREENPNIHNYTEPLLYLEKLHKDGYVNMNTHDYYQINLNGIEFINNGGYRKKNNDINRQKRWSYIKLSAVVLNALFLLYFAYLSNNKDSEKEQIINTQNFVKYK